MCGIVGYVGREQAAPIILHGLSKLEYRGYDSAGLAIFNGSSIDIVKTAGRLKALEDLTHEGAVMPGHLGIGHTRWATHGQPTDVNAHPHFNKEETIAVVHNGIIENYRQIKDKLIKRGYEFVSDTDTEVLVQLIDFYYKGNPLEAITKVMHRVEGSYALGIVFADHPDALYGARKDSPLIVGKSEGAGFIASDVPAVLKYTREVYFLDNQEIACVKEGEVSFYSADEEELTKESTHIDWDEESVAKGGYDHFMIKEMHEQPKAVRETYEKHLKGDEIVIDELHLSDQEIKDLKKIHIVACGTAYHVGVAAKYIIEKMARISVEVDMASEFRYRDPIVDEGALVIIISQSGETADSLQALRDSKRMGAKVMGIVNVVGSSIAREADSVMYTWAGPEIAVASTKAYSAQLIALYLISMKFAAVRETVSSEEFAALLADLRKLPEQIEMLLGNKERIQRFANRYIAAKSIFFIGRGLDYSLSMEGSLKLKEISYIHSEAYAAGELKHGPISLIEEGTLVMAALTQEDLYKKTVSNIAEVKSRGAFILAVTNTGHQDIEEEADYVIYIPQTNPYFTNSLAIIPLQLFAYYVSVGKGYDPDKPRNLAKSVTVE